MKIVTRLWLLFLIVGVLPLALFSYFNLQQDEATLRTEELDRMSDLADKKAIQLKSYLAERVQDVRLVVRGPRVMEAIGFLKKEYAPARPATAAYAREDALTRQYFDRYIEETKVFYDVFLITPQGEVVYSQKHESDFATNLLTGPWRDTQLAQVFRNASMMLEPVISGYEYYAPSSAPALFIAAPIIVEGKFRGVFAAQLGNELFFKVATDATGLGQSGEASFAQRDGDGVMFTTPLKYHDDAEMKFRVGLEQNKATPMFPAVSGESGEGVSLDYRGTSVVAAWRYLPELDWGMVVKIDAEEVFASIYQQRIVMLETVLGLLLFGGFAAYYFGRQISVPIKGLVQTANEVAKGDLDKRADEKAPGELGLFARAFNRMTDNLQASLRTLEERVEQRTAELIQSVATLRIKDAAIASSINAIGIAGMDGKLFYVNQAFVDLWRLHGPEDAIGHSPTEFADKPEDALAIIKGLQQQGHWQGELRARLHGGGFAYMELFAHMVMDEAGKPVCMMASFIDITARKRAEEEVLMARNQLEATIDAIPDLMFDVGLDGTYYDIHAQRHDLLAVPADDLFGKKISDVLPGGAAEVVMSALREANEQGRSYGKQFELPLPQGKSWFELSVSRKPDVAGQQARFIVLSREITERKQAEEALRISENRLKEAQRIGKLGYLDWNLAANELLLSEEAVEIFCLDKNKKTHTLEEIVNLVHPDDKERVEKSLQAAMAGTAKHDLEHRMAFPDGNVIYIRATAELFRDDNDEPVRLLGTIIDITELKQAEQMVLSSEARYQSVVAALAEGIVLIEQGGAIVEANEAAEKILGLSRDQMMGLTSIDPRWRTILEDGTPFPGEEHPGPVTLRTGKPQTNVVHGIHKPDGTLNWISVSSQPIFQPGESLPSAVAVSVVDITERRQDQVKLQRNQDLLNEAQRLGHLGSWELNLVSGELRWSDEIYRIFELDPEQFTPSYENFLNAIHPEDRDLVNRAYTKSLEDREEYDIEHRLQMADGRIKWVHEHCSSEFDASGKPLRSVGAVQDVTRRKLIEENLRVAAVAFETHEAIMITDADSNIIRVNQAFQDLTGYSAEDVLGRNPHLLSSGRQDKAFYDDMWQQLQNNGSWTGEIWDRRKDGHIYPKWLTITAVENDLGDLTGYVGIFNDISERKQAEEEIRNLAFYDVLTKLPNRRLLLDRLHLALSLSARSNHYGAVLFLDLDRFKTINDTIGHDYGDQLLIEVALRIQACVREVDTVARLGGDEFVILVEEISADAEEASQKIALIAEKIRASLTMPYQILGHEYHSSPSIGVCLYRGNMESAEELLKHADMAMYQAKDSGRNTVRFFDPLMQQAVEFRAELEADLRRAVPGRQLCLYYQVQIDNEHRALGAEALVRWMHPTRGMVSPAQFIPVAEESSLILEIGNWVLDTACQQLAKWAESELTRNLILAVNVSGQQFRMHDFVDRIAAAVRVHRIDPSLLKLELTESVVLSDVADVVAKMHALKATGVRLSMDDFGTGYSSLSYLKQLPLDQLKIDQSFVRNITTDFNDAVMVQTIIDLAKNFRLNVIAEGVETREQLEFLRVNGCMAYQGYLFSRPVPIEEFEKLLGM